VSAPVSPASYSMPNDVDRATFAVSLLARLRAAGVVTGLAGAHDFLRALQSVPLDRRSRLYWTARVCLVHNRSDAKVFDIVFAEVFDNRPPSRDLTKRPAVVSESSPSADAEVAENDESDNESGVEPPVSQAGQQRSADAYDGDGGTTLRYSAIRMPTDVAGLSDAPFQDLSDQSMQLLGRWLEEVAQVWPTRRTRRTTAGRHGRGIAVRPTIARARRTGWEPIELISRKPVYKPRRVVMLCDVSQSMQVQATAYLHLMRALALTAYAELFAFGTTLTRLTTELSHRSASVAIETATEKVNDRFGGTRIAGAVQTMLSSYRSGVLRGAVVIIASDGWDSDPPEHMRAAMQRLHRRAFRVIWINPRMSGPGYEPRVAPMAAALPYCDALLPAQTFHDLACVIREVSRCAQTGRRSLSVGQPHD
jgi:uncharacterized protein with von Willebrand factor type A (vWA) domain